MKLVIIESPYSGNVKENEEYARRCMADSLSRGEAPLASHLLYTQEGILDDTIPEERQKGMQAGFEWGSRADKVAIYIDKGMSSGMWEGVKNAQRHGVPFEPRSID